MVVVVVGVVVVAVVGGGVSNGVGGSVGNGIGNGIGNGSDSPAPALVSFFLLLLLFLPLGSATAALTEAASALSAVEGVVELGACVVLALVRSGVCGWCSCWWPHPVERSDGATTLFRSVATACCGIGLVQSDELVSLGGKLLGL